MNWGAVLSGFVIAWVAIGSYELTRYVMRKRGR